MGARLFYLSGAAENPFNNSIIGSLEHNLSKQIYSKLERLYLIKSASTYDYLELGPEAGEEALRTQLTPYGKDFMKFIVLNFDEDAYERRIKEYKNNSDGVVPRMKIMEEDIANPKPGVFG